MQWMILLAALGLVANAAAQGGGTTTLYKSVGPDGRTVYSDQPPAQARSTQTLQFKSLPATAFSPEVQATIDALRQSAERNGKGPPPAAAPVTLYSAKWCGYCKLAKSHLASRQIGYREFDIDTPEGKLAFVQAGGSGGVPLLIAKGQRVTGFTPAAYDSLLGSGR